MAQIIDNMSWEELKKYLNIGDVLKGTVLKHKPYGVLIDLNCRYNGIIQITDFKDKGTVVPEDYPDIGEEVQAVVLGFKDFGNQIWLGVKPSQISPHTPQHD